MDMGLHGSKTVWKTVLKGELPGLNPHTGPALDLGLANAFMGYSPSSSAGLVGSARVQLSFS